MTFVQSFECRAVYADNGGATFTKTWPIIAGDHATAQSYAGQIMAAFDALTNAVRVKYSTSEIYAEDTVSYSPTVDSETANRVTFSLALETNGKFATTTIQSPKYGTVTQSADGSTKYAAKLNSTELETYLTYFRQPNLTSLSDGERVSGANTVRAGKWSSTKRVER